MIVSIRATINNIFTPTLENLLKNSLQFDKMNIIIGDNGSGKSQLIGAICSGIDPNLDYDEKVYNSGIMYCPFSYFRDFVRQDYIYISYDFDTLAIYHQGINKRPTEITERYFGSNGESVLYELLTLTSDIEKYDRSLQESVRSGKDIIDYKSGITKEFINGKLDLTLKSNCTLICDEPELGLSPTRVKALINYLELWVDNGNQLIMTTNHPWMIKNWKPHLQPKIIDLDKLSQFGFSYNA